MEGYQVIDNLPRTQSLKLIPVQFWLLLTLEVVLADENGSSLLLTYPSYSLQYSQEEDLNEGFWAPPFFAHPVDPSYTSPDTVGAIMTLFERFEETISPKKDMGELAYLMGLPNPKITYIGSFTEIKKSPRSPEITKCYKVARYSCTELGARGKRNLADPECRKGYVFLPLDQLERVLVTRYCENHQRNERLYLSKPLISNLDYILLSEESISQLRARAIGLSPEEFRLNEEGLIVCMDLAGYGTACKYAVENMHSFREGGREIATYFRESISALFYGFLSRTGISQVHIAGDGFLAAMPSRHFPNGNLSEAVSRFMKLYYEFLEEIETFNSCIVEPSKRVGSRLALHYGVYSYGRIAVTRSVSADFDGASIIEAARLEAGLREYTRGPITSLQQGRKFQEAIPAADGKDADKKYALDHTMICSNSITQKAEKFFKDAEILEELGMLDVKIKEFTTQAVVYKIRMPKHT